MFSPPFLAVYRFHIAVKWHGYYISGVGLIFCVSKGLVLDCGQEGNIISLLTNYHLWLFMVENEIIFVCTKQIASHRFCKLISLLPSWHQTNIISYEWKFTNMRTKLKGIKLHYSVYSNIVSKSAFSSDS